MAKKIGGKQGRERIFAQMKTKRMLQGAKKINDIGKKPVTREELYNVQNTLNTKTDSSLMGVAALIKILVKNKLCTYVDFRDCEKEMSDTLRFIRMSMNEAYKELGLEAKSEDVGSFIYKKAIAFGIDEEVLINIFRVKPSESRIIKPSQVKSIIVPK